MDKNEALAARLIADLEEAEFMYKQLKAIYGQTPVTEDTEDATWDDIGPIQFRLKYLTNAIREGTRVVDTGVLEGDVADYIQLQSTKVHKLKHSFLDEQPS